MHFLSSLLLLAAAAPIWVHATAASCNLTAADWNAIKSAYLERNHYEALKSPLCDATRPESLRVKYGACNIPLGEILNKTLGLIEEEGDCTSYFTSTLYNGKGANPPALANTLCNSKTFGDAIKDNICNALTVVGCPTTQSGFQFSVFASCYGAYLKNKTREEQLAYYESGGDVKCMVEKNVCVDFVTLNWDTCPLNITDVFDFIDSSKATYTCETIFPSAPERCRDIFTDNFYRYCPLPTELEKNLPFIVVFSILGPCAIAAFVAFLVWFFRKPHVHHITKREVMTNAVNSFESFDRPVKNAHPELEAVLATSKFKNVVFDKKTQMWGVLGESKQYGNEKEAAQRAYVVLAKLATKDAQTAKDRPQQQQQGPTRGNPAQVVDIGEEYVVTAKPLTPEQTKALRFEQLVAFYEFWEPEKRDIPDHARNLLEKHEFDFVVRAIKTKYGVCPPSWDSFDDV